MPPRASHLPTSPERDALQKLRAGRELTPRALEPTGKRTVLIWSPRAGSSAGARPRSIGSQRRVSPPCSSRYPRAGNLTSIFLAGTILRSPHYSSCFRPSPGGLEIQQWPPRAPAGVVLLRGTNGRGLAGRVCAKCDAAAYFSQVAAIYARNLLISRSG